MNPVRAGSPVASVYRISSRLKIVCSSTATVVTQSSVRPCLTNTAGPSRNSPDPIEMPSTLTPGPTAAIQPKPFGFGAGGRSAGVHGGKPDCASIARSTAIAILHNESGRSSQHRVSEERGDGRLHDLAHRVARQSRHESDGSW